MLQKSKKEKINQCGIIILRFKDFKRTLKLGISLDQRL